ncbi:proline-rich receptor-like protein kinase PERK15 isoform X2 [Manihot esculenta]|uniref:proline-rich receptor-like protein kinase PERK15 isoform X2 n=1 Tax=Manihot esculenta TaxID=3983 RepID=UPI001CC58BC9|nr:proline-rich receptor-like protein kinase PERK15 isoform X2 [Manihot esculenta]
MMASLMNCFRNTEADRSTYNNERFGLREYSYAKLADATDKFSNANLLGEGGFGQVYKGSLDGKVVAIKKLKQLPDEQSKEGLEQEIKVVSHVSHKNLVKLVGYCIEGANRLLVLEYVSQKSLTFHLHGNKNLEWKDRMKIAIGSAKGLEYLHELCKPKIIHRDIKADNILIDDNFEPKVADFGLALFFPETSSLTHISISNKGTEVYADPENYFQRVSEKSDVYSYGVVLLELITGRKTKVESTDIVTWTKSRIEHALYNKEYANFIDSKLQANYVETELKIMIACAAACLYKPSYFRPQMRQIVRALEGYMPIKDIWDEKKDYKFINNSSKSNGIDKFDEFQQMVPKPIVNSEANNGVEQREFTLGELKMATNGSSNTTKGAKRFQAYFEEDYKVTIFTYQGLRFPYSCINSFKLPHLKDKHLFSPSTSATPLKLDIPGRTHKPSVPFTKSSQLLSLRAYQVTSENSEETLSGESIIQDEHALMRDLQIAIEVENYAQATKLRDSLRILQENNKASVLAANNQFYDAFKNGNLASMQALWAKGDNVCCVHPGAKWVIGYDEVIKSWEFEWMYYDFPLEIELKNVGVHFKGDIGYVTCLEVVRTKGGGWGSHFATNVFERIDGQWFICIHHAS